MLIDFFSISLLVGSFFYVVLLDVKGVNLFGMGNIYKKILKGILFFWDNEKWNDLCLKENVYFVNKWK